MAQRHRAVARGETGGGPVRVATLLVALVFIVAGVLGFVPGATTDYGQLDWYGPDSGAALFGVFQVSILHNIVHLAFGVLGALMAQTPVLAKTFLLVAGLIYVGLWLYGTLIDKSGEANVISVNRADDWLHLGLGVGMLLLGALPARSATVVATDTQPDGRDVA